MLVADVEELETMDAVRRGCCNEVWTMNGGPIPWKATAVC